MPYKKLFLTLLIISTCNILFATDYYVSASDGDDNNDGLSLETPFRTIQKAADILNAGDNCYIRGGTYRESITVKNDGVDGQPITITNYNDEQVIITGCDLIEEWEEKDDMLIAKVDKEVTQVFANGKLVNKARYPNLPEAHTMFDTTSWAKVNFKSNKTGYMENISQFPNLNGAHIVGLCGVKLVAVNGIIQSKTGNNFSVSNTNDRWSELSPKTYLGNGKGFILNNINLLDYPNEWYYQEKNLYLIPTEIIDEQIKIEAQVRTNLLNLDNRSFIKLVGLDFYSGKVTLINSFDCIINNCTFRYIVPYFKPSYTWIDRHINNPTNWQGKGIEIGGENNILKNSYVAYSWGDGITILGKNNTVQNCIIENCNWVISDCAPIGIAGESHKIIYNTAHTSSRCILVHRKLKNGFISHNELYNAGLTANDLGITYSFSTDGKNTEISYNKIHDNFSQTTSPGIYLDNWSSNYLVHHNIIWNCGEGIRLNKPQNGTKVFNNTMYNNKHGMYTYGPEDSEIIDCTVWNNIQDFPDFIGNDLSNNLYIEKDIFTDMPNNDYTITENSSAIDYGRYIKGFTDNYNGLAPDAGAYEYAEEIWTAGASLEIKDFNNSYPEAVKDFTLTEIIGQGKVVLNWENGSANETVFIIERKTSNTFDQIAQLSSNTTSFIDSNITEYTLNYSYQIKSFNFYGVSSPIIKSIKLINPGNYLILEAEDSDIISDTTTIKKHKNYILNHSSNNYILFKNINFYKSMDSLEIKYGIADGYEGYSVTIVLDNINNSPIGTFTTTSTNGWSNFQTRTIAINSTIGLHDIYIKIDGIGCFDKFIFTTSDQNPPELKIKIPDRE